MASATVAGGAAWALLAGLAAVFVQLAQAQGQVQASTLAQHPLIQWSYWAFDGCLVVSVLAVVAGGIPLWVQLLRAARRRTGGGPGCWRFPVVPAVYLVATFA